MCTCIGPYTITLSADQFPVKWASWHPLNNCMCVSLASSPAHICFTLRPPFFVCRLLHGNLITGTIPGSFSDLTHLKLLTMQDNGLSGSVPASIGKMTELKILYAKWFDLAAFFLWHNLCCADPCQTITSAGPFPNLFPPSKNWPSLMLAVLGWAVQFLSFPTT